jgi:hypothetical protein
MHCGKAAALDDEKASVQARPCHAKEVRQPDPSADMVGYCGQPRPATASGQRGESDDLVGGEAVDCGTGTQILQQALGGGPPNRLGPASTGSGAIRPKPPSARQVGEYGKPGTRLEGTGVVISEGVGSYPARASTARAPSAIRRLTRRSCRWEARAIPHTDCTGPARSASTRASGPPRRTLSRSTPPPVGT